MDRLEAMSIVLAVAEAGTLSAAARHQKKLLATVSRKTRLPRFRAAALKTAGQAFCFGSAWTGTYRGVSA